jgi:type I restriction enzyme R subunit
MAGMSEAEWEQFVLDELAELAWEPKSGKEISKGSGERESWSELIVPWRLRDAITRINPSLPITEVDNVVKLVMDATSRDARAENKRMHDFLTRGIREIVYIDEYGAEQNPTIWLLDRRNVRNNDFMAARQVRVVDGEYRRRFDVVLYVNGMPLGFIELKKTTPGGDGLKEAHQQLTGTYVAEFPLAFRCNVVCVVSDGFSMQYGTAFTPFEHFAPWSVDDDGKPVKQPAAELVDQPVMLLLHGMFRHDRFLELLFGYVSFSRGEDGPVKRIAKPHQYFAVEEAVGKTVEAVRGDGRAGVVWHTQGSGKSMEMELYANQVLIHPALGNPTIVVLTDRTDLDDQLFTTFDTSDLLPEHPVQVGSRDELRTVLASKRMGGIVFTTLQKFGRTKEERDDGLPHPLLSDRRNIVVIVDEAHRSHYDDLNGYARHLRDALPHASFIAFTGTPISKGEKGHDTRAVFGDYIELIYDLTQAVEDGATVRVYYEPRLIALSLPEHVKPEDIDEQADEVTAGLDDSERQRIQQRVAAMNAVYGAPDRLRQLSEDVVAHWEARSEVMRKFIGGPGKGMIVCATRDICAELYERIIAIKPDWHSKDISKGKVKVVYTGSAGDDARLQEHIRRPSHNKVILQRAKDPDDELELLIVHSMLLTGFDSPPLHTIYIDRPMRGAALMQALARVNRTFRNKQDGLLVGYAPITENLYEALAEYTVRDQQDRPIGQQTDEAVKKIEDLIRVIDEEILSGYDWRARRAVRGPRSYLNALLGALEYLRSPATPGNQVAQDELNLSERFRQAAAQLARMYAIARTHRDLAAHRDDIAFFEELRLQMARSDAEDRKARGESIPPDVELYLKSLVASAVDAGGVIDIYKEAGVGHPDLSHLDEAFIERMRAQRNPHLAIEALRRLIEKEMRRVTRHNIVKQEGFSDRLLELMRRYTNQNLSSAEIIAQLVALAKDVSADANRGSKFAPPLNNDELAFYDAVSQNESAVTEMGDDKLADIARDLVRTLRRDVTTDWVSRDDVRAKIRSTIKRLLAKHRYPPDGRDDATNLVLRQMETFADEWSPDAWT